MHIENLLLKKVLTLHQSFQAERVYNPNKKIYTSWLRETFEFHITFTAFTASTTFTAFGTTNQYYLIIDYLESNLFSNYRQSLRNQPRPNQRQDSVLSSSFINASNIFDITPSFIKAPGTSYSMWRRYYCCIGIKNLIFATRSLFKYI